jgi:hypothetical protein
MSWWQVYAMMEALTPGCVVPVFPPGAGLAGVGGESTLSFRMLYFSFSTLTGVGYGDIVPVTMAARMCAVTEAMMGQAYLYVMVGRLVGMQVSQTFAERAPAAAPSCAPATAPAADSREETKQAE